MATDYYGQVSLDLSGVSPASDSELEHKVAADGLPARLTCKDLLILGTPRTYGSGDDYFRVPYGVHALDDDSLIYVGQGYYEKIRIWDEDGNYVGKFGAEGAGDGQLKAVVGVYVDTTNEEIYVSDYVNNRVCVFNSNDPYAFKRKWGNSGTGDGEFVYPTGIVKIGDYVYVAEEGHPHRIQKFDVNGSFQTSWTHSKDIQNLKTDGTYLYCNQYNAGKARKETIAGALITEYPDAVGGGERGTDRYIIGLAVAQGYVFLAGGYPLAIYNEADGVYAGECAGMGFIEELRYNAKIDAIWGLYATAKYLYLASTETHCIIRLPYRDFDTRYATLDYDFGEDKTIKRIDVNGKWIDAQNKENYPIAGKDGNDTLYIPAIQVQYRVDDAGSWNTLDLADSAVDITGQELNLKLGLRQFPFYTGVPPFISGITVTYEEVLALVSDMNIEADAVRYVDGDTVTFTGDITLTLDCTGATVKLEVRKKSDNSLVETVLDKTSNFNADTRKSIKTVNSGTDPTFTIPEEIEYIAKLIITGGTPPIDTDETDEKELANFVAKTVALSKHLTITVVEKEEIAVTVIE